VNSIKLTFLTLVTVAFIAGCNGSGGPISSLPGASSAKGGVDPLDTVSTRVEIANTASVTIYGGSSGTCWTISPSPVPSIGSGDQTSPITLSYNTGCAAGNKLDITYQTTLGADTACTFETTYTGGSGFSYQANNAPLTACSVSQSHSVTYDELFTYAPGGSLRKKHK
jgi:hypothetical protein